MGTRVVRRVAATVVLGVALWLVAPAGAAPATRIALHPAVTTAGSSTSVDGVGFGASEAVDVFLDDRPVAMRVTNAKGAFAPVRVTVGDDATPGTHWVTVVGRRSGSVDRRRLTVTGADVWSQDGVDAGRSGWNDTEVAITSETFGSLEPAWTVRLAEYGHVEHLVAAGDRLFAAGARYPGEDRWDGTGVLAAIDATDGRIVWERAVSGRIATDGSHVFVGASEEWSARAEMLAVSVSGLDAATGDTRWTTALPSGVRFNDDVWAYVHDVVVQGDTLFVVSAASRSDEREQTTVSALDAADGAIRWQRPIEGWGGVAVVGDGVLVVAQGEHLRALDVATGSERWSAWTGEGTYRVSIADGLVFAPVRDRGEGRVEAGIALSARRVSDGRVLWRVPWDSWAHGFAVTGSTVIASGGQWESSSGELVALDTRTGDLRWDGFGVNTSPAGAADLYYSAESCGITARDPSSGATVGEIPDVRGPFVVVNGVVVGVECSGWDESGVLRAFAPAAPKVPEAAALDPDPTMAPDRGIEPHAELRDGWSEVTWQGLLRGDTSTTAPVTFEGAVLVGTRNERDGGGLFRSDDDGASFFRVDEPGLGDPGNVALTPVAVGDELIVVTENPDGLEVWASSDGESFIRRAAAGFDDPANTSAVPYVIDDRLLLGVANRRTGARLFVLTEGSAEVRTVPTAPGRGVSAFVPGQVTFDDTTYVGTAGAGPVLLRSTDDGALEPVPGFRARGATAVSPQVVFGERLYVAAPTPAGVDLYRLAEDGSAERVVRRGFHSPQDADLTGSLVVFGEELLMATSSLDPRLEPGVRPVEVAPERGFGLWRSVDGASWEQIGERGLGDPHATGATLSVIGTSAYLSASNFEEGDTVFVSDDGLTWSPLLAEDSSSHASLGYAPVVVGSHLVAVHGDVDAGLTAVRYGTPVLGAVSTAWWGWPAAAIALAVFALGLTVALTTFAIVRRRRPEVPPHLV